MEYDDKKQLINIATGSTKIVQDVIDRVNKVYLSDFKLRGSEDRGGVEFAVVERGNSTLDEIFLLGYYFGGTVQELRNNRAIDW